jgi:Phosphate transport (Pho88)
LSFIFTPLIPSSANVAIILFLVQLAKKIPMEDPNVLNAARGVYVFSNLVILGIYLYVKLQIDKKNGTFVRLYSIWKAIANRSKT